MKMVRMSGWRVVVVVAIWLVGVLVLTLHRYDGNRAGEKTNWMGFTDREARLAQRVREGEDQVQWLKLQLSSSQNKISQELKKTSLGGGGGGCEPVPLPCEAVHVAIVCAGTEASRTVVTLLKSILFYRRNPIHFHFISDKEARKILTHLTSTWRIPQVKFRFYNAEDVVDDVSWIPNKHYSGVYGLLKLTLPKILPKNLEKVIILDTDVTFATDIGKLWTIFQNFDKSQALGLVENQSDWYIPGKLWKNHRPWPALGRGLNTGVILMDLSKLRRQSWSQTWRTVAENDLVTQLSTSLADQDVLNAVLRRQSDLLYPLPCKWNVQMSDNSLSDTLCYDTKHGDAVNVIHFNSPKKLNSVNKHINYFKNLHLTFLQYDGNLLRRELYNCHTARDGDTQVYEDDLASSQDSCHSFKSSGNILYRSHIYFLPFCTNNHTNTAVTLVAQLSLDRLHMLEQIVNHWKGPISFALYLTDPESQNFLQFYENSALLKSRCDVGYHVVYKESDFYPVNFLRNLALDHAVTEYVFLSDVDFLPSLDMARTLQTSITNLLLNQPQRVLIVPAFESQRYKAAHFPDTKAELVKKLDLGEMFTFRFHDWPAGHAATNFVKWRTSTTPYTVGWKRDFEPYIVGRKGMVRYDTRFLGFGWNKVSHIMALYAEKYEFVVLPDVFIIHQPHSPSMEIGRYRTSQAYRDCLQRLKDEFIEELEQRTGKKLGIETKE
eukprot:GFUD01000821.1.p1 GENE.GFUD01000821.1~~GFUD01000821.1.p1  ORF type:complete len:719 (-),score=183.27 GFUD01000821.1:221-2377(-)